LESSYLLITAFTKCLWPLVTFHRKWLWVICIDFIAKDQWPPNLPDFNPLDYHVWGAMLQAFHTLYPKAKIIPEQKSALQQIWDDLP